MNIIPDLTINEAEYNLAKGKKGKIAVFIYSGSGDPEKILDYAIHQYVGLCEYYELIDSNLDNPWMRVILSDINDMSQENFDSTKHKLVFQKNKPS